MRTIWKYPFEVRDTFELTMPRNSIVLSVQIQQGEPCIWVYIPNTDSPREIRKFRVYGTGHLIDELQRLSDYRGTFQLVLSTGAVFVGHLFEEEK